MKTRLVLANMLALCLAALFAVSAFAAESVGNVVAARKEAWAARLSQQEPLAGKSPVYTGDTLVTNPEGRLQVLFRDDSALMMAPDSQARLSEYVYGGGQKPAFNLKLARGMARLISGRMAEGKPDAMKVETPDFTVDIPGARLVVVVNGPEFRVIEEQGTENLPILITNKKDETVTRLDGSGKVFESMPDGPAGGIVRPMNDMDRQFLRQLALPPSDQAMPKVGSKLDQEVVDLLKHGPAGANTLLNTPNLGQMALIDERLAALGSVGIEGTLESQYAGAGTYSFSVNLRSGTISNGTMSGVQYPSPINGAYNLSGGTGWVSGNSFTVNGFRGAVFGVSGGSGSMSGTAGKGFGKLGDIGASGQFAISDGLANSFTGAITSGRRVK